MNSRDKDRSGFDGLKQRLGNNVEALAIEGMGTP